eukprot:scaffold33009_cov57-Phaeocystis_antarctica.AAC.2
MRAYFLRRSEPHEPGSATARPLVTRDPDHRGARRSGYGYHAPAVHSKSQNRGSVRVHARTCREVGDRARASSQPRLQQHPPVTSSRPNGVSKLRCNTARSQP